MLTNLIIGSGVEVRVVIEIVLKGFSMGNLVDAQHRIIKHLYLINTFCHNQSKRNFFKASNSTLFYEQDPKPTTKYKECEANK